MFTETDVQKSQTVGQAFKIPGYADVFYSTGIGQKFFKIIQINFLHNYRSAV